MSQRAAELPKKWHSRNIILQDATESETERRAKVCDTFSELHTLLTNSEKCSSSSGSSSQSFQAVDSGVEIDLKKRLAMTVAQLNALKVENELVSQQLSLRSLELHRWTLKAQQTEKLSVDSVSHSLREALACANARIRELEEHEKGISQTGGDDADGLGSTSDADRELRQLIDEARAMNEKAHAIEKSNLDAKRQRELSKIAKGKGQAVRELYEQVFNLRQELNELRRQELHLMRQDLMNLVSQPNAGLQSMSPAERMSEAMSYLKSTVINFSTDLKKIKTVVNYHDYVKAFKEAHNELKVVVSLMLTKEENRAFQQHRYDVWPVNQDMLHNKFPRHKIDVCYSALQEMVIAWDSMNAEARTRLTTARDVVENAEVLYFMAKHVAMLWQEKRYAMHQRAHSTVATKKTPSESPRASPSRSASPRMNTPPSRRR